MSVRYDNWFGWDRFMVHSSDPLLSRWMISSPNLRSWDLKGLFTSWTKSFLAHLQYVLVVELVMRPLRFYSRGAYCRSRPHRQFVGYHNFDQVCIWILIRFGVTFEHAITNRPNAKGTPMSSFQCNKRSWGPPLPLPLETRVSAHAVRARQGPLSLPKHLSSPLSPISILWCCPS